MDQENVAWRLADGEAVVLHADTSAYFGMNQSATVLWAHLAEHPMTPEDMSDWARSRFSDAPVGVQDEIMTFLEQLQQGGLVVQEDADGTQPQLASVASDAAPLPWETPVAERYGELEQLILSGE